ncbi:hypothetical protein D3C87_1752560 [compost metagenome]
MRDEHRRFVCNVPNLVHVQCLISCGVYAYASDVTGPDAGDAPAMPSIIDVDGGGETEGVADDASHGEQPSAPEGSETDEENTDAGDAPVATRRRGRGRRR